MAPTPPPSPARKYLSALLVTLSLLPGWPGSAATGHGRAGAGGIGPVRFCVDPDWAPYEIINQAGIHEGIAADLLRLAADRAGLRLQLVPTRDWEDSIAASRRGDCDLLSFLNRTPKRDEWLVFTEPIFIDTNVIITREEHLYVDDLAALSHETIVLPKGTSIEEGVRRDFPNLSVITTESEADAFAMVSGRKADMTMRSLTIAVYTIKKEGWFNLKISGQVPGYENRLRVGVRKDRAGLRDILNRGIATITPQERNQIANRHVAINVHTGIDYGLIRNIVLAFLAILSGGLAWAMRLRQANARLRLMSRTDRLTELCNRAALDALLGEEIGRCARQGRALSVIMLDLDHFKAVNDRFGHLMGDRVLVAFTKIIKATIRKTDTVGRWGGEEFLVLCPGTGAAEALAMADHLCAAVRGHAFETGWRHTVSAGVSTLQGSDTRDALLHRADMALYRAKNGGRDRACAAAGAPVFMSAQHGQN
ncbi:Diguanylate cyclase [Rhodovastum atsumiense]|uniref:diguanylate cyclase n=1 Tax=Rhodovastum atsumiense TaxID=504468 RepID=A0A5M6ISX1_9PROT|nr:diguanylate cyclase [Rhodovastum atsumiense]KAA5611311.1 diguanylate cyclase [Rhodovastum atsumiense]CAH2601783.1 Diguanylate cyclase [Rhodovastum atsumiense]